MATDYTPVKVDDAFSLTTSAAVTAGQLVSVTGAGTVGPSAGGDRPIGVAAHSAASGAPLTVWPIPGYTHETVVANTIAITAGAPIISAANGQISTGALGTVAAAGTLMGIALSTGTGNAGGTVIVRWIGL